MIICPKCNTKNFNDSRECKNCGATKMTGDESDSDIGITSAISGGTYNENHGPRSTVSGGSFNITSAGSATISGALITKRQEYAQPLEAVQV